MSTIKHKMDDTRRRMVQFLNKREADEFTKTLYQNGVSFNPQSVVISSDRLNELNKEYLELKEIFTNLLRSEAIEQFISKNPDLEGSLKNVEIERNASGNHARVTLK